MTTGLVSSVQCPACGQFFLCQQQAAEGMVTCPHCAHQGYRAHFPTQGHTAGLTAVRRAVYQKAAEESPPAAWPMAPQMPDAGIAPSHFDPPAQPQIWRQPTTTAPTAAMQPALQLPPMDADDDAAHAAYVPPHLQRSPWKAVLLFAVMLAALGGGLWVWWDATNGRKPPENTAMTLQKAFPAPETGEIRRATLPSTAETTEATQPQIDALAMRDDVRKCVDQLFSSTDPAVRLDAIHDGERHAAEIAAFLAPEGGKPPQLVKLAALKGLATLLPGGEKLPLFHLTTTTCPEGAFLRLMEDASGRRRLHWHLLQESHEHLLAKALAAAPEQPVWSWGLIKRSHGFEISTAERGRYTTFTLHVTADGRHPLVACTERDTPLGRYLERETDWGQAYLVRMLLRHLKTENGAEAVIIIDCEGATVESAVQPR